MSLRSGVHKSDESVPDITVIVQYSLVDDECQSIDEWETNENIDTAFLVKHFDQIGDIRAISIEYFSIVGPHIQVLVFLIDCREQECFDEHILAYFIFIDRQRLVNEYQLFDQLNFEGFAHHHVHIDRRNYARNDLVVEP